MKWKILAILNLILLLTIIRTHIFPLARHSPNTRHHKNGTQKLTIDSEKLLTPTGTGFNDTHPYPSTQKTTQ